MDPQQENYSSECKCRIPYRCTCDSYENLENLYYAQGSNDKWKKEDLPTDVPENSLMVRTKARLAAQVPMTNRSTPWLSFWLLTP